jgi:NAD(P)H-dependent flavin oxidoreductase YrpB (nitropropane dioxygenase family)
MITTSMTELVGCTVPIQLAGMGPVCSDELCAAVSEAGGLGMITVAATPAAALEARLEHIRSLTFKPVGANFLIPALDRDSLLLAACSVRVIDFFWGDPDPELVKIAHGGDALASWQVGSAGEAVAAERAGCGFIIAQGIEAGGHIRGTLGLIPLLSQVLGEVAIPVLAAGGIGSARESAAHPVYVQALVRAQAEDSIRTTLYHVGCPLCPSTHGVLKPAIEAAHSLPGDAAGEIHMQGQRFPIAKFQGVPPPVTAMSGHVEAMCCYAGQSAGDGKDAGRRGRSPAGAH